MAERDLTTRFGADTSGFTAGVAEIVKQLDKYNKALVDNQYQIKATSKEISALEKEQKQLQEKIKSNTATETEKQRYAELTEKIEQHRTTLAQLRTDQTQIRNAISETTAELKNASDGVDSADEKFSAWKVTLANLASDTIENLVSKLTELAKSCITTGEEFSSAMSEVQAISGATTEEIEALEATAREYGSTTIFSATEAAQALKYMSLAGWNANQSMSALGGVLDLAAASGMDLAAASDMVTDYLSAFGMAAEDTAYFADLLAYAQSNSNTSAEQLGQAYLGCAANMNAAGQDIETTTSLLEAMANQGLKGSRAGIAVAAMARDITSAMENGKITIGETSIAVADAEGNYRDFTDVLKDIEAATNNMGTAEKASALSAVFTANSIKGVNLVLNEGINNIAGYEEALRSSSGAASEAAEIMSDNLEGDIKSMNSAFDELKLKIYDSAEGPLRNLVQTITEDGVPALEFLANHFNIVATVIVTATTAVLNYKAAIGITSVINTVKKAFEGFTTATTADTAAKTANTAAKTANTAATTADTAAKATNTTVTNTSAAASTTDAAAKTTEAAATKEAAGAQMALNTAMDANPILLIIGVIATLVAGIVTYIATTDSATESTNKFVEAIEKAKSAADDKIASTEAEATLIEHLGERYEELRTKINLTAEEKNELKTIAEQLAEKLSITTDEIENQNGEYQSLVENINATIDAMRKQAEINAIQNIYTTAVEEQTKAYTELKKKAEEFDEYCAEHQEEINEYIHPETGYMGSLVDSDVIKKYKELGEEVSNLNSEYEDCVQTVEEYSQLMDDVIKKQAENTEGTEKNSEVTNTLLKPAKELQNIIQGTVLGIKDNTVAINENTDATEDNVKSIEKLVLTEEELEQITKNVTNAFDNMVSTENALQSAIDEVAENHSLSLATLNNLVKKYPELTQLVNGYINGLKTEEDVIKGLTEVYKNDVDNYNNAILAKAETDDEFYNSLVKNSADLVNEYKDKYGIDLNNFKNAAEAKIAVVAAAEEKIRAEQAKTREQERLNAIQKYEEEQFIQVNQDNKGAILNYLQDAFINKPANIGVYSKNSDFYLSTINSEYAKRINELNAQIQAAGEQAAKEFDDKITNSTYYANFYGGSYTPKNVTVSPTTLNEEEDKLKAQQEAYEKALQERQEQLDLAYAAYEKLVNDRIDLINAESEAAQKAADKQISAIDELIEARKRLNEDSDRQAEIDAINAQLEYAQLDDLSRRELERKLQDLLDEQAEVDWEREMTDRKTAIQNGLSATQDKNEQAVSALQAAAESAKNYFDKLAGNQSNSQIVTNNSDTRNIQIIQNALSDEQMVNKLLNAIYSK